MISSDWRSQIFEKKISRPEFRPNGPNSGPKLGFMPFYQVWFISFPWNCIQWYHRTDDTLQQCLTSSRGKIHEKTFWGPNFAQRGQNRSHKYNTWHKFWDQSPSLHYQCSLQVSETESWHKLRCCYSSNMLQHWVGERGLIYFCKVDHSRISINFFRNWLGLTIIYVRYCHKI